MALENDEKLWESTVGRQTLGKTVIWEVEKVLGTRCRKVTHGFMTMDLVQCTTRSVTVVGGGANPPGSPGLRARRLQPLIDERVVAQVRIHPSQHCAGDHACPCVHALASLIVSSLGACAQAHRPRQPGQLAGCAGRVGRSQERRGGVEVRLPHPPLQSPEVL